MGFGRRLLVVLVAVALGIAYSPETPIPVTETRDAVAAAEPPAPRPVSSPTPACTSASPEGPSSAPWARRIDRIAARHSAGVAVASAGVLLHSHDGARRRVPASNQKLLLSMALLDRFGRNHRIPTRVAARTVAAGAVEGDLWILGGGDPTLTDHQPGYWGSFAATTLADLARAAHASGIRMVTGRVMGARGHFAHDFDASGWQAYVPYRHVQLPTELVLNGNFAIRRNPERAVARALRRELRKAGVQVLGGAGSGAPPDGLAGVATVFSPRLEELLAYVNRTSNNFFAEMLGKLLGADAAGPPGTIAKGARAIGWWARAHGEPVVARDSSGLSYGNRISAESLVRLLGEAEQKRWGRTLRRSLPAGGEGTLRHRLHGFDVRAKTGTLYDGTSSLAGWVRSRNGRWVAFAILGRPPRTAEDRIVRVLAGARIRPPASSDC